MSESLDQDFRLELPVVVKQYRTFFIVVIAVTLGHLVFGSPSNHRAVLFVLAFCVILGTIGLLASRRYVWVSLGPDGIKARGVTGRKLALSWTVHPKVSEASMHGLKGVRLLANTDRGFLTSRVKSIFVPEAVIADPAFQNALVKFAPPHHPLRQHIKNAA